MTYTLEQKALALLRKQLWWRFPNNTGHALEWSLMHDDMSEINESDLEAPRAEYHIGDDCPPTPRELTELEAELLDIVKQLIACHDETTCPALDVARALIAKAEAL